MGNRDARKYNSGNQGGRANMSRLCDSCVHRREPDRSVIARLKVSTASAAAQEDLMRKRNELKVTLALEQSAVAHTGGVLLNRRPVEHEWCAAQTQEAEKRYWFCEWLETEACQFYQPNGGAE